MKIAKFRSFLAFLLALLVCFAAFVACEKDSDKDNDYNKENSAPKIKMSVYKGSLEGMNDINDLDKKEWKSADKFPFFDSLSYIYYDQDSAIFMDYTIGEIKSNDKKDKKIFLNLKANGELNDLVKNLTFDVQINTTSGVPVTRSETLSLYEYLESEDSFFSFTLPAGETYVIALAYFCTPNHQYTENAELDIECFLEYKIKSTSYEDITQSTNSNSVVETLTETTEETLAEITEETTTISEIFTTDNITTNIEFDTSATESSELGSSGNETTNIPVGEIGDPGCYAYKDCYETVYTIYPVNLRSANFDLQGSISAGTELIRTGISEDGGNKWWSRVVYNGKTYYIRSTFLTTIKDPDEGFVEVEKTVKLNKNTLVLNIRILPDISSTIIGSVDYNEEIKVLAENTELGWYKIEFISYGGEKDVGYIVSDAKYFE